MSTNLTDKEGKVLEDNNGEIILATGTTVPADATAGYATGCIFTHTDGSLGTALYVNEGSSSSALFVPATPVTTKVVNLTNAEVKALRAAPKTLISAPGAGKLIVVESVTLQLNYGGTNAFTESADNLVVQYNDSGTDITGSIETTGFIDQTADMVAIYYPAAIAAMATATVGVNEAVELFNTGDGEIGGNAGNDNTLTVSITYRVVTMA